MAGKFDTPTSPTASAYLKAYFDPVSQSDFTESLATNAVGPYWLTFAFLPLLEKWKEGELGKKFVPQVIMTSSMNGWTKDPATSGGSFSYLYSKSAIGHATGTLAHELLPLGIRVNGIAPVSSYSLLCTPYPIAMRTDPFLVIGFVHHRGMYHPSRLLRFDMQLGYCRLALSTSNRCLPRAQWTSLACRITDVPNLGAGRRLPCGLVGPTEMWARWH